MKSHQGFSCKSYWLGGTPAKDIENPAKAFLANPIGWNENQLRTLKIPLRLSWQILKSWMKTH